MKTTMKTCGALKWLTVSLLLSFVIPLTLQADTVSRGWLRPWVNGRGLAFDYSSDSLHWQPLGHGRTFVDSDFGTWGAEKKMADPCLYKDDNGLWTLLWIPNPRYDQYAICTSPDLIHWKPQDYPTLTPAIREEMELRRSEVIAVEWSVIESLRQRCEYLDARDKRHAETLLDDVTRFANLQPFGVRITFDSNDSKAISDKLIGVFFEDISYGADGGLYGELIQNRDFEYAPGENRHNREWGPLYAWTVSGKGLTMTISEDKPIHENNPHYAVLTSTSAGDGTLTNKGYDGIPVVKGERYDLTIFGRRGEETKGVQKLQISLEDKDGNALAKSEISISSESWKKHALTLTPKADESAATLVIRPLGKGTVHLDMISLFPRNTFHHRPNGLRADLAQTIADIHPRFVRFPGGCIAHGDGIDNIYRWKNTIGPLEERKPMRNIWNYHQSAGLGYQEYFQFCEDIGAEPLPVLAAGVPCQNSSDGGPGQQGGIPWDPNEREDGLCMETYTQEILDLIEWANGDAKTTKWGRVRAQNGHPKPFGLKYIGIGNEDLISAVFTERFTYIYHKIHEAYPDIEVCGTVGPFCEGSDYDWGWKLATELGVPMVDEHYYVSPGWMLNNQDYYDHYDRSKPKVYLGEYAAHARGRRNCIESALCEALYLTNVERNADVVAMTSYAPLLCREGHSNWDPDMIYFRGNAIHLTPGYYVQQMFGRNSGDTYVNGTLQPKDGGLSDDVRHRISYSCVTDSHTGDIIVKIANLLPVSVETALDLSSLLPADSPATEAAVTILSGQPADTTAEPVTESLTVSAAAAECMLRPYSLTVIRIPSTMRTK